MKQFKLAWSVCTLLLLALVTSCSDDDSKAPLAGVEIETKVPSELSQIVIGRTVTYEANVASSTKLVRVIWLYDGQEVGQGKTLDLVPDAEGAHTLQLNAVNAGGESSKTLNLTVLPKEMPTAAIDCKIEDNKPVILNHQVVFTAKITSTTDETHQWLLNGEKVSTEDTYTYVPDELGHMVVELITTNVDGEASATIEFDVVGPYYKGTFVLNEGNMTQENGFVSFIDADGQITDSVYYKANQRPLGNVVQNMWVSKNHIYFISQNGNKMDGDYLVVAAAQTLKMEYACSDEFASLDNPSSVAAIDPAHIYVRDADGIQLFNAETKAMTKIEGTSGASQLPFEMINGKVYYINGSKICVISGTTVENSFDMGGSITGMHKTDDGNLWVAIKSPASIIKMSTATGNILDSKEVTEGGFSAGWGPHTFSFGAYGNKIYYNNASNKVYMMDFTTGDCRLLSNLLDLCTDAKMAYNNISVNPHNGEVFMHTIKGYGLSFLINDIFGWSTAGDEFTLMYDLKNHTHFPTGCYFTVY